MRFLRKLWSRFVGKRSGSGVPSSIEEPSVDVLPASAILVRVQGLLWTNKLLRSLIVTVSILCSSCGVRTKPDLAPGYAESDYASVEADLCGSHFFGVGGCTLPVGTSTKVSLTVQGFLTGEVAITSDKCHTDFKQRYVNSEQIVVPLKVLVGSDELSRDQSCTFRVVVSPDVIKNSEDKMYPRIGQFYVEVIPSEWNFFLGEADQVRESAAPELPRKVSVGTSGEFLLVGCGWTRQEMFQDTIEIIFPRDVSCKYRLAVKTSDGKKFSWIFLRNVYKTTTELLPLSNVTRKEKGICVDVSPNYTTFISINGSMKNGYHLCSSDPSPWAVRVFTTKRNSYELIK